MKEYKSPEKELNEMVENKLPDNRVQNNCYKDAQGT